MTVRALSLMCLLGVGLAFLHPEMTRAESLSLDQQLVVACYRSDVDTVVRLLRKGADVNAVFGKGDREFFRDPETGGRPAIVSRWTPLIAVCVTATRSNFSQHGRSDAEIEERRMRDEVLTARRREICNILLSHQCQLELKTQAGETALFLAVEGRNDLLAKMLIAYGADVNVVPRITIEMPARTSMLHAAAWSKELSELLIASGADDSAVNANGETPKQLRNRFHGDGTSLDGERVEK